MFLNKKFHLKWVRMVDAILKQRQENKNSFTSQYFNQKASHSVFKMIFQRKNLNKWIFCLKIRGGLFRFKNKRQDVGSHFKRFFPALWRVFMHFIILPSISKV